jgi:hypothetical protein
MMALGKMIRGMVKASSFLRTWKRNMMVFGKMARCTEKALILHLTDRVLLVIGKRVSGMGKAFSLVKKMDRHMMALGKMLRPVKSFFVKRSSLRAHRKEDDGEETWHELFFDLVYVAAALQLGDMIKYNLAYGVGPGLKFGGFTVSSMLFAAMRMTWDQLVTYQNR